MKLNYIIHITLIICVIFLFFQNNNLKKKIENFDGHVDAETSTVSLDEKINNAVVNIMTNRNTEDIKKIVNEQYNMDIEAIRNLGTISKSLLTGTNYHNTTPGTPGKLVIPADVEILGKVKINEGLKVDKDLHVNKTLTVDKRINAKEDITFLRDTPEKSYRMHWNGDVLHLIGEKEAQKGGWDRGFIFTKGRFENREGEMIIRDSNKAPNGHVHFFINQGVNGLEIAQRGSLNKLRLWSGSKWVDIKSDATIHTQGSIHTDSAQGIVVDHPDKNTWRGTIVIDKENAHRGDTRWLSVHGSRPFPQAYSWRFKPL